MKLRLFVGIGVAALAGCANPPRYDWGGYEDSLYHYYRNPSNSNDHIEVLAKAAAAGDATGRTAPGIHAEYGYMLFTAGKSTEAVAEFTKEKQLWPESSVFMDRMIKAASDRRGSSTIKTTATDLAGKTGS